MNSTVVRLISAFIPSKEKRRAFRDKHLCKRATKGDALLVEIDKRIKALDAKLELLVRFSFQKEIFPDMGKYWLAKFPNSEEVLSQLTGHMYTSSGMAAPVKARYISEQISLAQAFIHIAPDCETFRIFRHLLSLCSRGDAQYHTILGHYSWLLWRTGRHEELLRVFGEFYPSGIVPPAAVLRRVAASAMAAGDDSRARALLAQHVEQFGLRDLWRSYWYARLAWDIGHRDESIREVVEIGDEIAKNRRENSFENLLKGKRVAIVGNGPQEVGSENGERIDGYDIVIRFNDYPTGVKFKKDYGEKTDIWVRSLWVSASARSAPCVVLGEALHAEYPNLDVIREVRKMSPERVFAIPEDVYYKAHNESNLNHPTNGALMIAWVKSVHPELSADDVFGFSFKAEIPPKSLDHYYDSPDLKKGTAHSLDRERVFLRTLLNMD